jgi:hypothetical protein
MVRHFDVVAGHVSYRNIHLGHFTHIRPDRTQTRHSTLQDPYNVILAANFTFTYLGPSS